MPVLVICQFDEDPTKMKALSCLQHFHYCNSVGEISGAEADCPIWPEIELVRDCKPVLVTCNSKEDPVEMKAL